MKKLFLIIGCILFFSIANAQDSIILINGDQIRAKVLEIDDVLIKYHKFENLTGPVYSIKKAEVSIIKYQNGTQDIFSNNKIQTEKPKQAVLNSSENISMVRGKYVYQGKYARNNTIKKVLESKASPEIIQLFNKGCKNQSISNVFTYTGAFVELTGLIIYYSSGRTNMTGVGLAIGGFAVMTVGLPFNSVANKQIKNSILKYNNSIASSFKPELFFGATNNGIGLILKF